jgi:hypothetical protein
MNMMLSVICPEAMTANVLYWRRSGLLPLKLIRSTTVDDTTNVHTKH